MKKKQASFIWTLLALFLLFYVMFQTASAVNNKQVVSEEIESVDIDPQKTMFVTVVDEHYGVSNSDIKKVKDSLNMWEFDKRSEQIFLKYNSLLPDERTKMTIIYDKGYDSFEHHADVLSLINFPYEHHYQEKPVFEIQGVGENGEVYILYHNKNIKLNVGESYWDLDLDGYKLTKTTFKNHGLIDKSQFTRMKTKEEVKNEKENKPVQMNLNDYKIEKLEFIEEEETIEQQLVDLLDELEKEEE